MKRVLRSGMLLPLLMLSACATNNATRAPDANLSKLKTFYVVRLPEDGRGIEKLIAARLTAMGYQSASGDGCNRPGSLAEPVAKVANAANRLRANRLVIEEPAQIIRQLLSRLE